MDHGPTAGRTQRRTGQLVAERLASTEVHEQPIPHTRGESRVLGPLTSTEVITEVALMLCLAGITVSLTQYACAALLTSSGVHEAEAGLGTKELRTTELRWGTPGAPMSRQTRRSRPPALKGQRPSQHCQKRRQFAARGWGNGTTHVAKPVTERVQG